MTKRGMRPVVNPAQSVQTSSWPSTCGPAPTPMVGMRSSARHPLGGFGRHHLEHDRERAGVLDRVRVGEQLLDAVAAPLDEVTAEAVLALRGEADVRHDGDARIHDAPDLLGAAPSALELHRVGAGLLHEPHGGVQRLQRPGLVRAERHVGHDERALDRLGDRAGQRDEVVDRHRERRVVAEDVVARRSRRRAGSRCPASSKICAVSMS